MKATGWIVVLGVGALLLYNKIKAKINASDKLSYNFRGVKLTGGDWLETKLLLTLGIVNPTNESLAYDKFFGTVGVGNSTVANFVHDGGKSGITIRPHDETQITFPITLENINLAAQLFSAIKSKTIGLAKLSGTLIVSGFEIPVDNSFDLKNSISGLPKGSARISILN